MCKVTDFEFDEAILCVKPHAPNCAATIEKYVEQLKAERDGLKLALLMATREIQEELDEPFGKGSLYA